MADTQNLQVLFLHQHKKILSASVAGLFSPPDRQLYRNRTRRPPLHPAIHVGFISAYFPGVWQRTFSGYFLHLFTCLLNHGLQAAYRAAPNSPTLSCKIICTGIASSKSLILPFNVNTDIKIGSCNWCEIRGAIPPPIYNLLL